MSLRIGTKVKRNNQSFYTSTVDGCASAAVVSRGIVTPSGSGGPIYSTDREQIKINVKSEERRETGKEVTSEINNLSTLRQGGGYPIAR